MTNMKLTLPLLATAAMLSMGFAHGTDDGYAYSFDYDNDGSYAVSYEFSEPEPATPKVGETKYDYAFDYDNDDGYTQHDYSEPGPATPKVDKPFKYTYGFDYDNDGSYVQMYFFQEPGPATPEIDRPTKYEYKFDRDDDGSHAEQRTTTAPDLEAEVMADVDMQVFAMPLTLDPALREACQSADATFYFPTDVSETTESSKDDVKRLVACLKSPALAARKVEAVGHADPRGTEAYNDELANDRAQSVAKLLIECGLDADRIDVISKGESMADEPELWDDRRVVVRVR